MIEIKNQKYDSVSATLHWIVAFAVIGLIAAGKLVDVLPERYEPLLVENHKAIGVLVFGLVLFRLAWRLTHKVPPLPADTSFIQKLAAHVSHWTLYALMVLLPVSGITWQLLRGRGLDFWFFVIKSPFADDRAAAKLYSTAHRFLGDVILVLVIAHVAAALYHQFFKRDGLIERILPRQGVRQGSR